MYAGRRKGQVWQFRVGDKFIDQGHYPDVSYAKILSQWEEWRKAKKDEDPETVIENQKKAGVTIETICKRYIKEVSEPKSNPNLRSWNDVWNVLNHNLYPEHGEQLASTFTQEDAQKLIDSIQYGRGAKKAAYHLKSAGNQVWIMAIRRKWILSTQRPWRDVYLEPRQKAESPYLNESQIASFLPNLPETDMPKRKLENGYDQVCQDLLLLQLQTATRVAECAGLTWDEIDVEHGIWTLPASRAKNKQSHRILLSRQSIDLLKVRRDKATGEFVFPGPRTNQPLSSTLIARAIANNRKTLARISHRRSRKRLFFMA